MNRTTFTIICIIGGILIGTILQGCIPDVRKIRMQVDHMKTVTKEVDRLTALEKDLEHYNNKWPSDIWYNVNPGKKTEVPSGYHLFELLKKYTKNWALSVETVSVNERRHPDYIQFVTWTNTDNPQLSHARVYMIYLHPSDVSYELKGRYRGDSSEPINKQYRKYKEVEQLISSEYLPESVLSYYEDKRAQERYRKGEESRRKQQEEVKIRQEEERKKAEIAKLTELLRQNKVEPSNIEEVALKYDASKEMSHIYTPPLEGSTTDYFNWRGQIVRKDGNIYYVKVIDSFILRGMARQMQRERPDLFQEANEYFVIKNVKKTFGELSFNRAVSIVGRYSGNTNITFVSGETVVVPVLTDCYIGK